MSWGITAVVGGAIGSIGGAYMSSRAANKATRAQRDASAAQLEFEKQRYADWEAVYGPIQDNLSNYYQNVSPDYYAAIGLEQFDKQYQTSMQRLDEVFAQRGIDPSSGLAASLESQAELGAAETRAGIRRDAPRMAAEDKTRFLQIGLGQNPASSVSQTLAQQSQYLALQANTAQTAAGQAWGQAIPAIGRAIDMYARPSGGSGSGLMAGSPYIDPNTGVV